MLGGDARPWALRLGDRGIDWGAVLQGDRFYALLQVRALTYGPECVRRHIVITQIGAS